MIFLASIILIIAAAFLGVMLIVGLCLAAMLYFMSRILKSLEEDGFYD